MTPHSTTVRRLERDALIEKVESEIEYLRNLWEITEAGEQLLRTNPEHLAQAGREGTIFDGHRALWQLDLGIEITQPLSSRPAAVPRL